MDSALSSLIISPYPATRDYLLQLVDCTDLFFRIDSSRSWDEAKAVLGNQPVDALIIDWQHADLDLLEVVTSEIDQREEWHDIPLLLFTADEKLELELKALRKGASGCLNFRITAAELTARLQPHLQHKQRTDSLREENRQLARLAISDRLTGLYNRSYFEVMLGFELARADRQQERLSLMVVAVDRYDWLVEAVGQEGSDQLLQQVAEVLQNSIRQSDMACRFSHREFAVILCESDTPAALELAERLRRNLAEEIPHLPHDKFPLMVSIGISGGINKTSRQVVEEACYALSAGRRAGGGRVEVFRKPVTIRSLEGSFLDIEQPQGHA